ncbi:hypothetical protein ASPWEDRAFT_52328 [Aspergillus wentii DTO 134E9]|uniref:Peptidase A1 domain-containing protein n=1 Tax=Aspergillus wentii DTO 134E9 TaxID=1073089 RepID=A0A1L9RGI6_ASPWE|nr:uncharacterized protein ASPWEDRAFT_52328 [Aspergillus wentii DTO 134E9]OJJ33978.1 hypothetical protein ASPWEDRAFT_52328 [Aspergillus wentii DTO 134E9]
MPWSENIYGPDGPWHAVSVNIGIPRQAVDLYPGGRWSGTILTSSVCDKQTPCYSKKAGLYNQSVSDTAGDITDFGSPGGFTITNVAGSAVTKTLHDTVNWGSIKVPNVSLTAVESVHQTYPGGQKIPVEVGVLSLGSPQISHVDYGTWMFIPGYLWTVGEIPSYSYGLHIGSASQNIPGSLYLGGYDQNRVLGDISTQSFISFSSAEPGGQLMIDMTDIGLGVATGGSPWNFTMKDGLLTQSNSSILAPFSVEVNPVKPYLYLPQSTCDAITSHLPVTFNQSLGLYLWDTDSSHYQAITSSPAYLWFMFLKDTQNNQNITIKVPFALLNLTLEAPLVEQSTPYFPCYPVNDTYTIGRAFLQAAFISVNWATGDSDGRWFLAQAPGPAVASTASIQPIAVEDKSISGSTSSWENSWEGRWTPLPDDSNSNTTSNSTLVSDSDSPLSIGAKAGIGVGCAVAGLVLIGAVFWILVLRRRRAAVEKAANDPNKNAFDNGFVQRRPQYYPHELGVRPEDSVMPSEAHGVPIRLRNPPDEHVEMST